MKHKIVPILAITTLMVGAIVLGTVNTQGLVPSALAADTQQVISAVKTDSNEVYAEIQENIDSVTALKTRIETLQAEGTPLPLDEVVTGIEAITKSYESLAARREDIKANLLSRISDITAMQGKVNDEIATLNERRADYTRRISEAAKEINPEISRTRQKALNKSIAYIDMEIGLWRQFSNLEASIADELTNIQEQLDGFMSLIDSSATLFREGLNLLELQQSISNAMSLFTIDQPQITRLSHDMESSWDTLDFLATSLTSLSLNQPNQKN